MNNRRLDLLVSPGFLGSLFLLLLNDFVLKQQLHNALTGKLSDFAGLFVFPLVLTALFPRLRSTIYVLIGFSFILWKSEYSQSLIQTWNGLALFSIGRTIDYGDLLALLVLPLSYAYSRRPSRADCPRPLILLIAIISTFAFTATSYKKETAYDNEYPMQISKADLRQRMRQLPANRVGLRFAQSDTYEITFDDCASRATITLKEKDNQSFIVLKEIVNRCPGGGDKEEMLRYFERVFINRLKQEPVTRSGDVLDIWSQSPDEPQQSTPQPRGSALPVKQDK